MLATIITAVLLLGAAMVAAAYHCVDYLIFTTLLFGAVIGVTVPSETSVEMFFRWVAVVMFAVVVVWAWRLNKPEPKQTTDLNRRRK